MDWVLVVLHEHLCGREALVEDDYPSVLRNGAGVRVNTVAKVECHRLRRVEAEILATWLKTQSVLLPLCSKGVFVQFSVVVLRGVRTYPHDQNLDGPLQYAVNPEVHIANYLAVRIECSPLGSWAHARRELGAESAIELHRECPLHDVTLLLSGGCSSIFRISVRRPRQYSRIHGSNREKNGVLQLLGESLTG